MARHTRRLAAALRGDYGEHFYDKSFKHGRAGRRTQQRLSTIVSKRVRILTKRETARIVADES